MPVKQRFHAVYVILLAVLLFASCQSDETKLNGDAVALSEIRTLNTKLSAGHQLNASEFNSLKDIFSKYPASETVRQPYENALFLRKDWASLAGFYESVPGEELTEVRKKNLAKVYVKLGNFDEAARLASEYDLKTDDEMRLTAVTSLYQLGKYDQAKKILDESWEKIISGKKPDEMVIRGMIYFYEGDNKKALDLLEKVVGLDPLNVSANNGLSRVYSAAGDTEKAAAATAKVQEYFDKLTETERSKTRLVEKTNQLQAAYQAKRYQEVISVGLEILPESEPRIQKTIYEYLYNSYLALGKEQEAREVIEKVKQLQQQ